MYIYQEKSVRSDQGQIVPWAPRPPPCFIQQEKTADGLDKLTSHEPGAIYESIINGIPLPPPPLWIINKDLDPYLWRGGVAQIGYWGTSVSSWPL